MSNSKEQFILNMEEEVRYRAELKEEVYEALKSADPCLQEYINLLENDNELLNIQIERLCYEKETP